MANEQGIKSKTAISADNEDWMIGLTEPDEGQKQAAKVTPAELLSFAELYISKGFAIFPLPAGRKSPSMLMWPDRAAKDISVVRGWLKDGYSNKGYTKKDGSPGSDKRQYVGGWGILTGAASGLFVLDVDTKDGKQGALSLATIEKEHGSLPITPMQTTGSGGLHYFFRSYEGCKNSAGVAGVDLDTRGDGGFIVGSPSIHPDTKKPYAWTVGLDVPIADTPEWLIEKLKTAKAAAKKQDARKKKIPRGKRNDSLNKIGFKLRKQGLDEAAIYEEICRIDLERCDPPLASEPDGEAELHAIAHSAAECPTASEDVEMVLKMLWDKGIYLSTHATRKGYYYAMEKPSGMEYFTFRDGQKRLSAILNQWDGTIIDPIEHIDTGKVRLILKEVCEYEKPYGFNSETQEFNTWRGFPFKPIRHDSKADDLDWYLAWLLKLFGGDKPSLNWYIQRIAYILQCPAEKAGTAILLRSDMGGSGKDLMFITPLKALFGSAFVSVSAAVWSSPFNSAYAQKLLCYLPESTLTGRVDGTESIKALITDETIPVHGKNMDAYTVTSYLNLILTTNRSRVFSDKSGGRRFALFNICEDYIEELRAADTKKIRAELQETEFIETLYRYLMDVVVDFNLIKAAPSTEVQKQARLDSMSQIHRIILNRILDGDFRAVSGMSGDTYDTVNNSLTAAELQPFLKDTAETRKYGVSNTKQLGHELTKFEKLWKGLIRDIHGIDVFFEMVDKHRNLKGLRWETIEK
ncbi:hypothetical protein FACS1894167_12260 [Synergistales bacterium]|nr:hypothetical protein FACS1894167_12260 [Synergistales bacterium]